VGEQIAVSSDAAIRTACRRGRPKVREVLRASTAGLLGLVRGGEQATHQCSPRRPSGLRLEASLLLMLAAAGGGCYHVSPAQPRGPGVVEVTQIIGTRHHTGPIAFSPDGRFLALPKREDGRVELWSLETGKARVLLSSFNKDRAPADEIAFSHDGGFLGVYHRDKGVTVWDIRGLGHSREQRTNAHRGGPAEFCARHGVRRRRPEPCSDHGQGS
jgi:WD40 repeat protein